MSDKISTRISKEKYNELHKKARLYTEEHYPIPVLDREAEMERTAHGDDVADEANERSAYGNEEPLTIADVWNILDNIHSNFLRAGKDNRFLSVWMNRLEAEFPEIPTT